MTRPSEPGRVLTIDPRGEHRTDFLARHRDIETRSKEGKTCDLRGEGHVDLLGPTNDLKSTSVEERRCQTHDDWYFILIEITPCSLESAI